MKAEKVLGIDLSSKTGWAVVLSSDKFVRLEAYGQVPKIECPEASFPSSYVMWAYEIFSKIEELIEEHQPDVLVVEQTCAGSKNAMSQKMLEWSHFLLGKYIQETGIKNIYLMTSEWRKEVGSYMNAEEKKHNKMVKDYKKKNKTTVAYDINTGKRIGRIGKKHVTIRLINEAFKDQLKEPLRKKDEDIADAASLVLCYHKRRLRNVYE